MDTANPKWILRIILGYALLHKAPLLYIAAQYYLSGAEAPSDVYPSCLIVRSAHYPWGYPQGGKRGVLGGKACFASRLPPRVHSEDRFLAEGPLEGPGAT